MLVRPSNEGIKNLHSRGLKTIDMRFLNHHKPAYSPELKLCERRGLIKKVDAAGSRQRNAPGNPQYSEYV